MYQPVIRPIHPLMGNKTISNIPVISNANQTITGISTGMAVAPALQNGQVDLSSSWIVGSITANNITVGTLSAITENVGTLIVNTGGSISSGMTAFNVGVGYWFGTDGSGNPQIAIADSAGNYVVFDGSTANPIAISSTGVINILTSKQSDDGQLGQSAVWANITGVPSTIAGYNITDAQYYLGFAAGQAYVLRSDGAASPTTYAITNATWASGVLTITCGANTLAPGNMVQVSNITPATFNGTYQVATVSSTGFTAALAANPGSYTSGGVVSYGPYWGAQYTGETNVIALAGTDMFPAGGNISLATSYATVGNTINIPNPGQSVTVAVAASFGFLLASAGTVNSPINGQIQISFDGGSTWTTSTGNATCSPPVTTHTNGSSTCFFMKSGTPSADIQVRLQAQCTAGNGLMSAIASGVEIRVFQNSTYTVVGQVLSATVPGTASGSCSAIYPATTCTAVKTVTASPAGGLAPYTYSWAKVSGTGSITAGSTSRTVTVSDTETTSDAGASHSTTVNCTVTDSQSYATTAGSQSAGTATVTIGAHEIPVGAKVNVSGCTPTNYNGTGITITGVTATQIQYTVTGSPGAITVQGTVNNVSVTTGNCVITDTFYRTYAAIGGSVTTTPGYCNTTICGQTCTATGKAKANPTGGNGSYTYSWSITSGGGTITAGATSQQCTVTFAHSTSAAGNSGNQLMSCAVNDSRGTGSTNLTGTILLTYSCGA